MLHLLPYLLAAGGGSFAGAYFGPKVVAFFTKAKTTAAAVVADVKKL